MSGLLSITTVSTVFSTKLSHCAWSSSARSRITRWKKCPSQACDLIMRIARRHSLSSEIRRSRACISRLLARSYTRLIAVIAGASSALDSRPTSAETPIMR